MDMMRTVLIKRWILLGSKCLLFHIHYIFIDDFLYFWNCYWPQEKQWVFSRCLHLLRCDKVCLRWICRQILLPRSTKVHIETTWVCPCWLHYRHHQHGRWQSWIDRVAGNKDLYLGTFSKRDLYMTVGFVFWIDKYKVSWAFWGKGTCRRASCLLLPTNVGFEIYSSEKKSMHSRLQKGVLKWTKSCFIDHSCLHGSSCLPFISVWH